MQMLPKVLQQLAPIWPSYHLHQVALEAIGVNQDGIGVHVLVLGGFAVVFFAIAARRLRRYG